MSFFNKMPAEAKNKKKLIFAEKYDDVFSDEVTADKVLLAVGLFNDVENRKRSRKKEILQNPDDYEIESYILHATYYILYALSKLADFASIPKEENAKQRIINMYDVVIEAVHEVVRAEKKVAKEDYTHRKFFISNRPKLHLDELLKNTAANL